MYGKYYAVFDECGDEEHESCPGACSSIPVPCCECTCSCHEED